MKTKHIVAGAQRDGHGNAPEVAHVTMLSSLERVGRPAAIAAEVSRADGGSQTRTVEIVERYSGASVDSSVTPEPCSRGGTHASGDVDICLGARHDGGRGGADLYAR